MDAEYTQIDPSDILDCPTESIHKSIGQSRSAHSVKVRNLEPIVRIPIVPIGKPRMTRSDRWKQRDCTDRYWLFKDEIRAAWGNRPLPDRLEIKFVMPMPESWSKKKRSGMTGKPHQQKPDIDNLIKSVLDSLCENDAYIWQVSASKVWGDVGAIEIFDLSS